MNKITSLFKIKYPIVQAGMVWCSGWKLASAVSNNGGLGLIGSGSMYPDVLEHHIQSCQKATSFPFGVNVPLLYPDIDKLIEVIIRNNVRIVFTSAGNPKIFTETLKKESITVVHVISSSKFAIKAQDSGCHAVVAEGFEAGGHNGREETTTLCLVPQVVKSVKIPVIATGGISSGASMFATMSLGADGVQIGSRFAASEESSAHQLYKKAIINAKEGDTKLTLKELTPVRMLKNEFYDQITQAYINHATKEDLKNLLGKGRAKKGIFEGDLNEGELEIGQISASIFDIKPAAEIINEIIREYNCIVDAKFTKF